MIVSKKGSQIMQRTGKDILSPHKNVSARGMLFAPLAAAGFTIAVSILISSLLALKVIRVLSWTFAGVSGVLFFLWLIFQKKGKSFSPRLCFPVLFTAFFAIGMFLAGNERSELLRAQKFDGLSALVSGTVSNVVRRSDGESRFLIKNAHILSEDGTVEGYADVLFYGDSDISYDGGEKTVLYAALSSDLSLTQIGMGGQLISYQIEFMYDEGTSFFYPIYHFRSRLLSHIRTNCYRALGRDDTGMMLGILFGSREAISDKDNAIMQGAGLAHLLAVSGLHIAAFFSLVSLALKVFGRRASLVGSILVTGLYVFLTGSSVSSVRAFTMLALFNLAELTFRPKNTSSVLGTTALFFCITNPNCVFQSGTLLSFLSIWCIYSVSPLFKERSRLESDKKSNSVRQSSVFQGLMITISISAATLPVMTIMTGYIPLLSPFSAFMTLPLMSVLVVLGLCTAAFGGCFFGKLTGTAVHLLLQWIRIIAKISDSGPKIPLGGYLLKIGVYGIAAFILLFMLICGIRQFSLHRRLIASLTAFLLSLTAFLSVIPDEDICTLTALKGSLILEKGDQALLIGAGKNDSAGQAIANYLRANGVMSYTLLIPEGKRSFTGGAYALFNAFLPEKILTYTAESSLSQALTVDSSLSERFFITNTSCTYRVFGEMDLVISPTDDSLNFVLVKDEYSILFKDKDSSDISFDGTILYYDAPDQFLSGYFFATKTAGDIIKEYTLSGDEFPEWNSGFTQADWSIILEKNIRLFSKSN